MAIVQHIHTIRDWLEGSICNRITLKLPCDDKTADTYPYQLVHPAAFPLYFPGMDLLPPGVPVPIPSVCVDFLEGSDDLIESVGQLQLRLSFAAWNPGLHGPDMVQAQELSVRIVKTGEGGSPEQAIREFNEAAGTFVRNADGWQDVWNFVDLALRELESAEYINGLRICKEEPIRFGPFSADEAIMDFYPYWWAWISFTVEYGLNRPKDKYKHML